MHSSNHPIAIPRLPCFCRKVNASFLFLSAFLRFLHTCIHKKGSSLPSASHFIDMKQKLASSASYNVSPERERKKATNTRKLCQLPIATGTKTRVTEKRGKYNKRLFSMPSKVNSISFSLSESEVYQNVRTNSINWSRSSLFRSVKLLLFGPLRRAFLGNLFACPWIKPET